LGLFLAAGVGPCGLAGFVRGGAVFLRIDELLDHRARLVVALDELDAHAGGTLIVRVRGVALPHDAADTREHGLLVLKTDLKLEQSARRERRRRLDEDASPAHVVGVVLDELVNGRALVADRHRQHPGSRVLSCLLGHPDLTPLLLPEDADFHPLRKDYAGDPNQGKV